MNEHLLIIFTRNMISGKVKTRLAATIGSARAIEIYEQLLERTQKATERTAADKVIYYSDYVEQTDIWGAAYLRELQQGRDLGERMHNAFRSSFHSGYRKVIIIGTDVPQLQDEIIESAFAGLEHNDIVIGPAFDGGYYLIGMKQDHPELFENMEWSSDAVFETTFRRCQLHGWKCFLLKKLHDIDEEKDLVHFNSLPE